MPLRSWFLVLALMLNAEKSASAYQISRDLGLRRATVWSMMHRIRAAMAADPEQDRLMHGIVEADETYVDGEPRKGNNRDDDTKHKPDRGTVVGLVERGGRVVAEVANDGVGAKSPNKFIARFVDKAGWLLVTDEWASYNQVSETMLPAVVRQKQEYAVGMVHTNTIAGLWAIVERAWYGSHRHYGQEFTPPNIVEACYKCNRRTSATVFADCMSMFVGAPA